MNLSRLCIFLSLITVLTLPVSYGQNQAEEFLGKDFIDANFRGGYDGYINFFESKLTYPQKSFKNKIEGLNLFYYEVNPAKKAIKVTFLTLLDKDIEKNINATIQASRGLWEINSGGAFRIYQPVVYSNLPYYPQTFVGDLPGLPDDLPIKFQELIVKIKSSQTEVAVTESRKNEYTKVLNLFEQRLKKKTYRAAYDALCEVIRYNPLNREFLIERIKMEQGLGFNKYQVYDSHLLSDFVDKGNYITHQSFKPTYDNAMDSIYSDGKSGFHSYIHNNIDYPELSIQNKTQGAVIVAITGSKKDGVRFDFLTKLDDEIESMLTTLLVERQDSWKTFDESYTLYQPILFSLNESYPDQFEGQVDGFSMDFKQPILEPAFITADQDPPNTKENQHLIVYNKSKNKVEANVKKGKSKKAVKDLNVMLRYNPFDIALLELRIAIESELGKDTFTANDLRLIEALKADN
jgi:hypothetical protein